MFCKKCGKEILKESSFCSFCGEELYEHKDNLSTQKNLKESNLTNNIKPNKNNKKKTNIIFFIAILIFFGILGSIENKSENEEIGNVMKDIIYETETSDPENKKYVDSFSKIYEPMKIEYRNFSKNIDSVDLLDLLETSSFKDISRMKNIVSDLNYVLIEWEKYDNKLLNIKDDARNVLIEDFGKLEGEKLYSSFEEGFNRSFVYAKKYNDTGQDYYNNIILLYNFLIINYNDYKIDYDEYGEEDIYFYSNYGLNTYNQYIEENNKLYESYILSEKEYNNYMNNNLREYGMSVEDIENFMEK